LKVGDIVRWVGFPGASPEGVRITGPRCVGIIIHIHETGWLNYRIDVAWADDTLGNLLYPQTLEVISGSR